MTVFGSMSNTKLTTSHDVFFMGRRVEGRLVERSVRSGVGDFVE